MAVKSIIDVEVGDEAFKRFAALFDRYQGQLAKTKGAWTDVNKQLGASGKGFEAILAAQLAVAEAARQMAAGQKKQGVELRFEERLWAGISRHTKTIAGNIDRATRSLLRWSAITGVVSGLLGAGGLFGIDRLAAGVAGGRRSSLGLGTGYGAQRSFGVNFARLVDPDSFLEAVAGARLDVTKRVGLIGAGLTQQETQGDTAGVAVSLLRRLKQIADKTDPALYGQVIAARQLGQFTSPTDLLRLRNTSPAEFEQLVRSFGQNKTAFGLDDRTQRAWQDFTTQMARAGQGIETTFVRGLLPLEKPLERLSAGFERAVSAFLGSDTIKRWMDDAGKGLETFAKYIGTDEFQQNVRDFVSGLGNIAKIIGDFVKSFSGNAPGHVWNQERPGHDTWNEIVRGARENRKTISELRGGGHAASATEREAFIRKTARELGISEDQAMRVARSEGFGSFAGDKGTSFGDFQLHYKSNIPGFRQPGLGDEFTKYTGLDARDPKNWQAADKFALEQAKTHGWGPWHGWRGSQWEGINQTKVTVENVTGGSAVVTTNQVAE